MRNFLLNIMGIDGMIVNLKSNYFISLSPSKIAYKFQHLVSSAVKAVHESVYSSLKQQNFFVHTHTHTHTHARQALYTLLRARMGYNYASMEIRHSLMSNM